MLRATALATSIANHGDTATGFLRSPWIMGPLEPANDNLLAEAA